MIKTTETPVDKAEEEQEELLKSLLVHNQEVNLEFIIKNCSRRRELLGNPKILQ